MNFSFWKNVESSILPSHKIICCIKEGKNSSLAVVTSEENILSLAQNCVLYMFINIAEFVWIICCGNKLLCLKGTAVSKSRQVSSLHCHPRWHHVKHCVENCLHCGWAESVLSWCTRLQKTENEFQCCWTKYGMTYTAMWGLYVAET